MNYFRTVSNYAKWLLGVFFHLLVSNTSLATVQPLIWNLERLEEVRIVPSDYSIYKNCMSAANGFVTSPPVVVTNKIKSFAPDPHYYSSIATYWWPDPNNPRGKYIRKDGRINPETNEYDLKRIRDLVKRTRCLSFAYYWTGEQKYYDAYIKQLRAWFIDKETYMYPNMEFSQVMIGHNGNKGRGAGLVEAYNFIDVLESLQLVKLVTPIEEEVYDGVKAWFEDFLSWLQNSEIGKKERKEQGNIPLSTDVLMVYLAKFCGDKALEDEIVNSFASYRLSEQIKEDGSQPIELTRANAYTYSVYNLTHIVDFCIMMESSGTKYYKKNRKIINSAFGYLYKYVGRTKEFPYSQLSWTNDERSLMTQMLRLKRLRPKKNRAFSFSTLEPIDYYSKLEYLVY